jgi:hypothetical protein
MESEVFVLGLHNFSDDRVVYESHELKSMKKEISKYLREKELLKKEWEASGGWHVYKLDPKRLHSAKPEDSDKNHSDEPYIRKSSSFKILSIELGYYHHRVIVHFIVKLRTKRSSSKRTEKARNRFLALREVRKELTKGADKIIDDCVEKRVNTLVDSGDVREEGRIEITYTYPLIKVKGIAEEYEPLPFSEETTSLCFDVVEPCWWPPSGRKHLMRISIPSTILYIEKKLGRSLLRDIINAIYQHCLYEKKAKDEKKIPDNVLDESLLVNLWTHILSTMGGSSVDINIARMTNITRFLARLLALLALGATIAGFIFALP